MNTRKILLVALLAFSLFSTLVIIFEAARFNWDSSLSLLASQLITGHISLDPTNNLPLGDVAFFNGRFYLYFGLLPSIILAPFVAFFGDSFPQLIIGLLAMVISFYSSYSIAKSFGFKTNDALFLAIFFVFSTVIFSSSVINITAYQVQVLACALLALSLERYFAKKNMVFAGLFFGLALLTRFTLVFASVFFIIEFLKGRISKKQAALFLIPLVLCLTVFSAYNFLRFQSPLETGYSHIRPQPFPLSKNIEHGMFSLAHVPANLYSFLVMPPDPILHYEKGFVLKFPFIKANPWGMAIWFTSPLFLYLLFYFKKNKYTLSLLSACFATAIPLFTYFSVGFAQFGYRYALDFLPFLFIVLASSIAPKLNRTAIALIIIGVVFNCIYITSLWDVYPMLGIK